MPSGFTKTTLRLRGVSATDLGPALDNGLPSVGPGYLPKVRQSVADGSAVGVGPFAADDVAPRDDRALGGGASAQAGGQRLPVAEVDGDRSGRVWPADRTGSERPPGGGGPARDGHGRGEDV